MAESRRTSRRPVRCVIGDRSEAFSRGLAAILADEGVAVEGYGRDSGELRAAVEQVGADVAVIAVDPADEAIRWARGARGIPVFLVSSSERYRDPMQMLRAGVLGFLSREASGEGWLWPSGWSPSTGWCTPADGSGSSSIGGRGAAAIAPQRDRSPHHREQEVVQLVTEGCSNKQIAPALAQQTVKNHLRNIMGKLGMGTRAELLTWALDGRFTPRTPSAARWC